LKSLLVSPQVFSSAKYPAPERLQEYCSIFAGAEDPAKQKWPRHKIQSKHRMLDEKSLQVRRRRKGHEMNKEREFSLMRWTRVLGVGGELNSCCLQ